MTTPNLKPCPFCGEKTDLYVYVMKSMGVDEEFHGEVYCRSCKTTVVSGRYYGQDTTQARIVAIDTWNQRVEEGVYGQAKTARGAAAS